MPTAASAKLALPRSAAASLKGRAFSAIRGFHMLCSMRELPRDLAIYFHNLEPESWDAFKGAISYFLDRGYRCVSAGEFSTPANGGKRLFVSFDDNFANWCHALGVMDDLGLMATFYVNTAPFRDLAQPEEIGAYFSRIAYRGPDTTLTRDELKDIAAAGHTIGCHTHSHFRLSTLTSNLWDAEILNSKHLLEEILDQRVTDFSYPYGMRRHFTPALRDYCQSLGFETIATGRAGLQHVAAIDPCSIHRTGWNLNRSLHDNLCNLKIDGRVFERITGRSPIG